ncbi:hypothetical protein [Nitrosomonas aestuarii]|uniref:hypothetical protein n=1 Tax=Nitrosomonas aestuarii TaxID=52441 RepID=UPI000D451C68|nr:hypothetical protein [Nitrosomonas aestuarii]PTN11713.1 hypothetical protein C8R11_108132 [Nitrosomonas aestuarii]
MALAVIWQLATGNEKGSLAQAILTSDVEASRFPWHYAFRNKQNPIDLDAILAGIDLE